MRFEEGVRAEEGGAESALDGGLGFGFGAGDEVFLEHDD